MRGLLLNMRRNSNHSLLSTTVSCPNARPYHGVTRTFIGFIIYLVAMFLFLQAHPLMAADNSTLPASNGNQSVQENAVITATSDAPAFPFQTPQVGPLIKHTYPSIVDRRTTAFIPSSSAQLSKLTPIVMPSGEEHWIRVDLSEQTLVAYEGMKPVRAFIISSGLPGTPTVTGKFRIRTKVRSQTMVGGSGALYYYLPNVQWVQYFYEDYGFHGTYWHNDFGRPHSHGCINMTNADAKWLFDWAQPQWDGSKWQKVQDDEQGTLVIVHE